MPPAGNMSVRCSYERAYVPQCINEFSVMYSCPAVLDCSPNKYKEFHAFDQEAHINGSVYLVALDEAERINNCLLGWNYNVSSMNTVYYPCDSSNRDGTSATSILTQTFAIPHLTSATRSGKSSTRTVTSTTQLTASMYHSPPPQTSSSPSMPSTRVLTALFVCSLAAMIALS